MIASIGRDDKIAIIDLNKSTTEVSHHFSHSGYFAFQDTSFPAISPDGRLVAACSAADGSVYCFDVASMKYAGTVNAGDATCVFWAATAETGNAESFELVTGHRSGVLKFWEASETVNK
jgi:WD40 repeat protein